MIVADIIGPWWRVEHTDDADNAYIEKRREPQFYHDVGITTMQDVTGQLAEIIPPTPGLCAWRVWTSDEQFATLQELPQYSIVRATEASAAAISPKDWPKLAASQPRAHETDAFPPLPDSGWLEAGAIYQHGEQAVIVRQGHERTIYEPSETPALFMIYRADAADVLAWIAGESVAVGTQRTYDGVTYECLQAHVTQADWTPDATPALWSAVVEEPTTDEWTAGVWYDIGDQVTYGGVLYECIQAHTSQAGWEPPNVPALWSEV